MAFSVVDPLSPAIERTQAVLFRPFDIGKWFVLGFSAFLAELGSGWFGRLNFNYSGGKSFGGTSQGDMGEIGNWIQDHIGVVFLLAVAALAIGIGLGLVFTWIGSRGEFMFLDGVVRNRAEVRRPWRQFAHLGNSLFLFRFFFGLAMLGLFLLVIAGCLVVAWPDLKAQVFSAGSTTALIGGIFLVLVLVLAQALVTLALHDFVVPIMYIRQVTVKTAWLEFRDSFLSGHIGLFIRYALFQIVIGMAIAMIAILMVCVTCCLAALPYLGSVILLPLTVFSRSYSLYFIEQFGPEWRVFGRQSGPVDDREQRFRGNADDDRFFSAE